MPQGTTVTIWVSNGQTPEAPLPDFRGLTPDEATEAAETFGIETGVLLSFTTEEVPVTDANEIGRVVETSPAPGTVITASASVVLRVGIQAPPPTQPPGNGGGGGGDGGGGNDD